MGQDVTMTKSVSRSDKEMRYRSFFFCIYQGCESGHDQLRVSSLTRDLSNMKDDNLRLRTRYLSITLRSSLVFGVMLANELKN